MIILIPIAMLLLMAGCRHFAEPKADRSDTGCAAPTDSGLWPCGLRDSAGHDSADHDSADPVIPDGVEELPVREGRAPDAEAASPGERRILLARSEDGRSFERLNEILLDQSNGPSALRRGDAIFVYSNAHKIDGVRDNTVVSVRWSEGGAWTTYVPVFNGLTEDGVRIGEPDASLLPDGRIRLYFTAVMDGYWTIRTAISDDGLVFDYEGESIPPNGGTGHDGGNIEPLATLFDGDWTFFVTDSNNQEALHGSSADDGITYEIDGSYPVIAGGNPAILATWFRRDGGAHVTLSTGDHIIGSASTDDGLNLTVEDDVLLTEAEGPLESDRVWDAAIVQDVDDSYLMFYVTVIPE